ncbi:THUMP domain-containing class I SAM-dependent RNA methyltransferase [Prochlorococcus marinus]|uniref:Putative RNA methylase family UPF0020 n=1 Tax=Prochlorococcus marinus (strain MIT 9211) TaxID=93059 RepID=A9B9F3_PROM4|nr:THUMP domain-containing protein [Prochlorococcus marinus]ABX07990.1 Putative RNA methylase family UPF0020 [Prochlorococcus marinus str. MIT 9211]
MKLVAIISPGLEAEAAKELYELGAAEIQPLPRCVEFQVDLQCFYRIHLRSRLPFRFLREIARFHCNNPESLYTNAQQAFDWIRWLPPSKTFKVDVSGTSFGLTHSHFTALQVKNAIIDLQRSSCGKRSDISVQDPDICIHLHLHNNQAVLSLDSSAHSLHRRGFRPAMGVAPLKENLAAGLLRLTNWDFSMPLVDPLCGSGTFLIEGAALALGLAPGLHQKFLFTNWPDFDTSLWEQEKHLAQVSQLPKQQLPKIIGCEKNSEIANQAKSNIIESGLGLEIKIQNSHFFDLELPNDKGLIVCNPPYGKRSGKEEDLETLYNELGSFCKKKASGWNLWLLNGNPNLSKFLRLKAKRRIPVSNGGIDCRWLHYEIN